MIADYREKGVAGLEKYEVKKGSSGELSGRGGGDLSSSSHTSSKKHRKMGTEPVRTVREEAVEISDVIMKATDVIERRKDRELTRKKSLELMHKPPSDEEHSDSGDELERELMRASRHGRCNHDNCFDPNLCVLVSV